MEHGSLIDKPAQVERDESGPAWASGNVEDLKRITTLFERHDEGLVHGTFDRYSAHDAANDLRNGWLKLGPATTRALRNGPASCANSTASSPSATSPAGA
jgi:hypothetical protein